MGLDLLIPFGILIVLVIYLIYTRTKFEKDMLNLYEKKFEEWKEQNPTSNETKPHKDFVGLVFKEDYKISIEIFDNSIEDRLKRGKFDIICKE
ncbi:hypothetical protein [Aliarcobacter vitoriensis]|uniref:Uncharacterized protein n=1 Tax=Aliarcobacter vitoriensis TaxID=2011099 RepID=A0A366MQZ8_9BACT|nr:hypothetical protein [Aliarcobacter vitoriensis]RBQ28014.1 hypothetical protein CRU91_11380 [Aliarcobacter vitoriensis]